MGQICKIIGISTATQRNMLCCSICRLVLSGNDHKNMSFVVIIVKNIMIAFLYLFARFTDCNRH